MRLTRFLHFECKAYSRDYIVFIKAFWKYYCRLDLINPTLIFLPTQKSKHDTCALNSSYKSNNNMETVVIQHSLSTEEGKPAVVQGTAVASPYDHHTKDGGLQSEVRDPNGPGVGEKQVSYIQLLWIVL